MDDLISEFITETSESLATLDMELVRLEQNPDDKELLSSIFRLMHTIKGTCGFLGLPRLENVAHKAENLLGDFRDDVLPVTPEAVTLILESIDRIKSIVEYIESEGSEPEGDDTELIEKLKNFGKDEDGGEGEEAKAAPEGDATPEETPAETSPESGGEAESAAETAPEEEPKEDTGSETSKTEEEKAAPPAPAPEAAREKAVEEGLKAAGGAKPPAGGNKSMGSQSIRVNLDILENLMQMVSELVLTRNQLLQLNRNRVESEYNTPLQRLSHITTELQEGVMKTRMQPIGNAWAKFPRLIRDLSIELGKKIELRMVGAETELDRQLLEMIKDPLTHMVRNSCDHGLESTEARLEAGKPETGVVTLSAFHEGGHIIMEISDDGGGIDPEKIKAKAIANGLTTEAEVAHMNDQQILQFIFRPGFSTADKVTSVSGRGVGMDVVRTNIEKIGGTIDLKSTLGKGSVFQIKIPLTLAIVSVLIVEAAEQRFAIPQISIVEMVRAGANSEHLIEAINETPVLRLRERLLPLISLREVLGFPPAEGESPEEATEWDQTYIVVCKVGSYDFGVMVDKVFNTEEIVVKPLTPVLQDIEVYSGSTILGDGSVIMILDPNGLAKTTGELTVGEKAEETEQAADEIGGRPMTFLVFKSGDSGPKAVPLELVSRLEEIDASLIEYSGKHPVIQYRGDLMRLVPLDPSCRFKEEGIEQVIVFNYGQHVMGLVVEDILDIVEERITTKLTKGENGYLGSTVIAGKTTDVIDVGYFLTELFGNLEEPQAVQHKPAMTRVLLVDDSPFYRNLIEPVLSMNGYKVKVAESGEQALELLQKSTFDAVVTDIDMPGMSGLELGEKLRETTAWKALPLIAFTAQLDSETMNQARDIGFDDFVDKDDKEALVHGIHQLVMLKKKEAA